MKIMVLAANYPYPDFPFSGIFNERCVLTMNRLCDLVEVVVPRPYTPFFSNFSSKWQIYSKIKSYEERNGIAIHRPPMVQIPKIGASFWIDIGAFICCRNYIRYLHQKNKFNIILSFDLLSSGGLAWRMGRYLNIPACGWAFGSDVKVLKKSSFGKVVNLAIKNLDLVFYQSYELLERAAELCNVKSKDMSSEKHKILPHGIPLPAKVLNKENRESIRCKWGIKDDEIIVISIGRITKEKGIYELLKSISYVCLRNEKIKCILVGAMPAFDESVNVKNEIQKDLILSKHVQVFSACNPNEIWGILSAADIFLFASHKEGMPNSLIEAMAMGVPSVAFEIPPIKELDGDTGSIKKVPPFDTTIFGNEILTLASSPEYRKEIGEKGKQRVSEKYNIERNVAIAITNMEKLI
ncbi:MAG: glycosyltransferase family 4 protein [Candidatus Kuenenia sp.]|nr:glycosyltransferase family 4 protein [Candidatus Kuenenia hertensis]